MWKEEYRLGVETIDSQHQQLFKMVDGLLLVIEDSEHNDFKKECANAVNFLYDYTVNHFKFEEGYQASIGYKDMEAHKLQHKRFIITVENFAKKMSATDYDMKVVKAFSGSLVAWLNYHVGETDQKIVGKNPSKDNESLLSCLESFSSSVTNVIMTMLGLGSDEITKTVPPRRDFKGEISYKIGLVGAVPGKAVFEYSGEFARSIIKSLISRETQELDEIAYSAMAETSNIIGGKAAMLMSGNGKLCDITTPSLMAGPSGEALATEGFNIKTQKGDMQLWLAVD
jgi:hemerythrin-like metal-binding protein